MICFATLFASIEKHVNWYIKLLPIGNKIVDIVCVFAYNRRVKNVKKTKRMFRKGDTSGSSKNF